MKVHKSRPVLLPKNRRIQWQKRALIFLGILIIFTTLIWFFFFSPIFLVQKFYFSDGLRFINLEKITDSLNDYLANNYRKNNLLFIQPDSFRDFFSNYPSIENWSLKKDWYKKQIYFEIKEKEARGVYSIISADKSEQFFIFDESGFIFAFGNSFLQDDKMIRIIDSSNNEYKLGEYILGADNFEQWEEIRKKLTEKFSFYFWELKKGEIEAVLRPIASEKSNTWKIIFTQSESQISLDVLNNLIKGNFDFNNLEYLDLRSLPNIYFKRIK